MKEKITKIIILVLIVLTLDIALLFQIKMNLKHLDIEIASSDEIVFVITTTKTTTTTTSKLFSNTLILENSISQKYFDKFYNLYNKLDKNIRKSFEDDDWSIILVNSDLKSRFNLKYNTSAVTEYPRKRIYIDIRSNTNSFYHEIGHFVDYRNNFVDETDEFINIYRKEKEKFIEYTNAYGSNTKTTLEYFAEAYEEYIVNPEKLKTNCPLTYNFINNINKKTR